MRGAGLPQAILITEHWIRAVADYLNVPAAKVSKQKYNVMSSLVSDWH